MNEHLPILRRVGWLLVIVGVLDIGLMIYCIANQLNYSSSLNIFAVAAGIFLLRGHLGAVRVVTWFTAFMFSGLLLCSLVAFPWMQPVGYSLLIIREHPIGSLGYAIFFVAVLWMLFWIYRQLQLPAVIEARVAAGHVGGAPKSAFIAGTLLAVFLAVVMQLTLNGEAAREAKRLAAEQYGSDYEYFVSSINWSGRHISARLTAYKGDMAKEVAVEWQQSVDNMRWDGSGKPSAFVSNYAKSVKAHPENEKAQTADFPPNLK